MDKWTTPYARTDETHDQAAFETQVPQERRLTARGIEVGHIFYFGTKYSEPLNATVIGPDGEPTLVHSGSYGIGPSRLVAAIIEASHDDAGIIWPEAVAPFDAAVVNLKQGDAKADAACEAIYGDLTAAGVEPLYDDRDERAGVKFASMDLIGAPWRVTVGPRGLAKGVVELTERRTGASEELSREAAVAKLVDRRNARLAR